MLVYPIEVFGIKTLGIGDHRISLLLLSCKVHKEYGNAIMGLDYLVVATLPNENTILLGKEQAPRDSVGPV